jgi:hypothetical protein
VRPRCAPKENRGQTGRCTSFSPSWDAPGRFAGCVWGTQTLPASGRRPVFADGLLSVEPVDARCCVRGRRRTPLIPAAAPCGCTAAGRPTPTAFLPPPENSASLPPTTAGPTARRPDKHRDLPYRNAPPRLTTATPPPPAPFSRAPDSVRHSAAPATNELHPAGRNKTVPATRGRWSEVARRYLPPSRIPPRPFLIAGQ